MTRPTPPDESPVVLDWDSKHWGFGVARLASSTLSNGRAKEILDWCRAKKIRCLFFAADASCGKTLKAAQRAGFRFVETRMELVGIPPKDSGDGSRGGGVPAARMAVKRDLPFLENLARAAHQDTRFFKDSAFCQKKARELYVKWIRRDFRKNLILVIPSEGKPKGYLSLEVDGMGHANIGLLAVESQFRQAGLGQALVSAGLRWLGQQGAMSVQVATQASNVAALRIYETAGFRMSKSRIWFHRWFFERKGQS